MHSNNLIQKYKKWYSKLITLYPKAYREKFGEGMVQTFNDLCREKEVGALFSFTLWVFTETFIEIIKKNLTSTYMQNKKIYNVFIGTALLLLIPFLTNMSWDLFDFIVAGILLSGTGLIYQFAASRMNNFTYKLASGIAIGASLILVWMNLAVGLIGNENNPANLLYAGVLAVGFIGSLIAYFKPEGMMRTMFAMAITQILVPIIAIAIWRPEINTGVLGVFILNGFFVAMFIVSALLFRRAYKIVSAVE